MIKLSVIIPYAKSEDKFRKEALGHLINSINAQTVRDFEVIVVEEVKDYLSSMIDQFNDYKKVHHIGIRDPEKRPFNKSWCYNVGIKEAYSDNILCLDADCIFAKDYFEKVLEYAKSESEFFHGYNQIILLPGRDNPVIRVSQHEKVCSTGGSFYFNRDFLFNNLGGMNENYFGYGREDSDMYLRAKYYFAKAPGTKSIPELNYPLTHWYHHWAVTDSNESLYKKNCNLWEFTIAHIEEVIEKLKKAKLGNLKHPTLIEMGK